MKRYRVRIVEDAELDLLDIWEFVAINEGDRADRLLEELESVCSSLAKLPLRGRLPPELERIGVSAYREVHLEPYRIIYRVDGREVYVHCVLDGRRDMQTLLERRFLRVGGSQ